MPAWSWQRSTQRRAMGSACKGGSLAATTSWQIRSIAEKSPFIFAGRLPVDIFLSRTDTGQARWNAETFAVPIYSPAGSWSSRSSSTKATERKKKLRRQGGLAETRENPSGPGELAKVPCPVGGPLPRRRRSHAQRMATMPDALGCRRSWPACAGDCWVQKKGRKRRLSMWRKTGTWLQRNRS